MLIKTILIGFIFFLTGCQHPSTPQKSENQKPLVLVSIAPYQFLAEQIGKESIEVRTMIPPGANPHSYEPTSKQVLEMSQGSVWFRIGEPFENKILSFLRENHPDLSVYDLREGVDLLASATPCSHAHADHFDRHIWLSPKRVRLQAIQITEALSLQFPEKAPLFQKNLQVCLHNLEELDQEISTLLTPLKHRSIIVSHPAFTYFCHDYQLQQLSVEEEGKDPRPRHLEAIMNQAKQEPIKLAFALPQYNNKGAQLIAKHLHIPVRMVNPYDENYFETMRTLAHLIADPKHSAKDPR